MKRLLRSECERTRASFSSYLDQTISGREMHTVAAHLEHCFRCSQEFEQWRQVQRLLADSAPVKAPADLGLQLRLAISHEKTRRQGYWLALSTRWENLIRPVVLQVASGLAGALLLVGGIATLVGIAPLPIAVLASDQPLRVVTVPHYLYSAVHEQPILTPDDATIVVEADISPQGKVYDYNIVSGPIDPSTQAEVVNQLMLQIYEPARMFGEPIRGHVLVTFSGVQVRG